MAKDLSSTLNTNFTLVNDYVVRLAIEAINRQNGLLFPLKFIDSPEMGIVDQLKNNLLTSLMLTNYLESLSFRERYLLNGELYALFEFENQEEIRSNMRSWENEENLKKLFNILQQENLNKQTLERLLAENEYKSLLEALSAALIKNPQLAELTSLTTLYHLKVEEKLESLILTSVTTIDKLIENAQSNLNQFDEGSKEYEEQEKYIKLLLSKKALIDDLSKKNQKIQRECFDENGEPNISKIIEHRQAKEDLANKMLDIIESIKDVPRYRANGDKTDKILQDHDRDIKNIKDRFADELNEIQSRISVITSSDLGIQGNLSDLSDILNDMANNSHLGLSNKEQLIFEKLSFEMSNISNKIKDGPDRAQTYLKECASIINQFCKAPETKLSQNQAIIAIAKDLSKMSEALLQIPPLPCPKEEQNISKFKDMKSTIRQNRASINTSTIPPPETPSEENENKEKDGINLYNISSKNKEKITRFMEKLDFQSLTGNADDISKLQTILREILAPQKSEISSNAIEDLKSNISALISTNEDIRPLKQLQKEIDSIIPIPQAPPPPNEEPKSNQDTDRSSFRPK